MNDIKISSKDQKGGITAHNVNISGQQINIQHSKKKKSKWAIIVGIITTLAAIVAILTYFGINPKEKIMSGEKKIDITSINQKGGITAHTVNIGPQARSMNDQIGNQLKHHIPISANVRITAVLGDGEAFGFAGQILDWMKSNGYSNVTGVDQAVYTQPVIGQNISKKSDNEYEIIIGKNSQ